MIPTAYTFTPGPIFSNALDGLPDEAGVGLIIEVGDLDAAAACVGMRGVRNDASVTVAPNIATGVILEFIRSPD
jgi:hypothetical protein